MTERKDQPSLRVIDGGRSPRLRAEAPSSAPASAPASAQLGLPGMAPPRRALICATVAVLEVDGLDALLRELQVRQIVDLRVAPSFLRLGLRRRELVQRAEALGAGYLHLAALSNRFAGETWDAVRYRERLERHYLDNLEAVKVLRSLVDEGPVLLIVAEGSSLEQELLVRALEDVSPDFELRQLAGA
ncbi:DUF488 family protein [Pseudenhygromyxa sp. WMMC2535]|uniref:DUF488 family protein n=1 Tax=Pseudenhygromyxa sp. WMMC2535 TaxID=2712867 RepID=UPI0015545BE2|nr:DUF488 family protein [Pseudenhygromyxa sp. WMMC2535]NVB40217.1 DUF488 family protein [Pseudenhygromyxa sp. WMMC2535]